MLENETVDEVAGLLCDWGVPILNGLSGSSWRLEYRDEWDFESSHVIFVVQLARGAAAPNPLPTLLAECPITRGA
jgi:hypothetical protein